MSNEVEGFAVEVAKDFLYTNPLHFDLFPSVRQMELEVGKMVLHMLNAPKEEGCSVITSGGTESLILAIRSYKNYGIKIKGIEKPEIVMGRGAHPAIDKGCNYFGVKLVTVPIDPETLQTDLKALEDAITSNTVAIFGSAPSWPFGVVDDIEKMSKMALKYGLGLHVDACFGSFIIGFHDKIIDPIPFDYRIEGVTSMSCDNHKYGIAPKGISTLTFRTKLLRS